MSWRETSPTEERIRFVRDHRSGAGQWIGLEETDDGVWSLYLCKELVARYDERTSQPQR